MSEQPTTAITLAEKNKQFVQSVSKGLNERRPQLAKMLPANYDVDRFIGQAIMIIGRNPDLLESTQISLVLAIMEAAEIGLDLAPGLQQCCVVARKDSKSGTKVARFQPMARGLITLAVGSGGARAITSQVVRKGDTFEYDEGAQTLSHVRGESENDEDITHVYARAVLPSGEPIYEVLTAAKVESIRKKAATDYIWKANKSEMYRKTAVRQIIKYLPIPVNNPVASKLSRAVENDNELFDNEMPIEERSPIAEPKRKSDAAKTDTVDAASEDITA